MSDWQPQVVVIESIRKHPDADVLDIATVLTDYPVIVKRDEYRVGDLVCYIPIDSIVPDTDPFYFLCPAIHEKYEENGELKTRRLGPKYTVGSVPEKYRVIKAKRIRGTYSQGMLMPLTLLPAKSILKQSVLPPEGLASLSAETINVPWSVGDQIVDALWLKKHEEEEEDNLPGAKKTKGANQASPPKGWTIPHYDIDGVRKYLLCLQEKEEVVLTEKLHGSNAAFCHDGTQLWVKSRNYYKKRDEDDMWWDIAIRYDLENKLQQFPMMVFFGEVVGQVKGFRYEATVLNGALQTKLFVFDVFNESTKRYLDYDDKVAMIRAAGLDPVPELYRGPWLGKEEMYPLAEGMTTIGGKHLREGWVLNTVKERYEPRLDSRMQVKLVGEGYNLAKP
jgi:hypothetical protein